MSSRSRHFIGVAKDSGTHGLHMPIYCLPEVYIERIYYFILEDAIQTEKLETVIRQVLTNYELLAALLVVR